MSPTVPAGILRPLPLHSSSFSGVDQFSCARTAGCFVKAAPAGTMAKFLTQDQINEFKECFSLYDRRRRGKIEARELITVMRCLGSSPTPSEVQRHLLSHNLDREGELDFSSFLSIMHQQLQQEAPEQEVLEAMRMADKEQKGFILASELRAKLTGLGEKLTDKEVDELLQEAGVGADGRVHCEQFAKAATRCHVKR